MLNADVPEWPMKVIQAISFIIFGPLALQLVHLSGTAGLL